MSDDLIKMAKVEAQHDHAEAGEFRADATTLRGEARGLVTEATTVERMGLADDAVKLRGEAGTLQARAADFDQRAIQMDDAGTFAEAEADALQEREAVRARLATAEGRAVQAEAQLKDINLTGPQRTELVAQAGAAAGEAAALHTRDDQLTNEAVQNIDLESRFDQAAHDGLTRPPHHEWGEGAPPQAQPDSQPDS
jgi:hypothetical protein